MTVTPEQLGRFQPFRLLAPNHLAEACQSVSVHEVAKGKMVFKREAPRDSCWWLLSGSLDLVDASFNTTQLEASDEKNNRCLAETDHYQHTAIATSDSQLIQIDQDTLDLIMTLDQATEHYDTDDDAEDDWMSRLLSSRLFEFVPPANIQALFQNFSQVTYGKGDVVIRQGDTGDYYYVVKQGRASIDRTHDDKVTHLKEVGPGDSFGEDALISNKKRNANVTMLTNGVLMRLGKQEYNDLLVKPVSEYVTLQEIRDVIAGGEQKIRIIDVRHPSEIEVEVIEGTRNIPLQLLRSQVEDLDHDTVYVVATPGRRAELGALVLTQAGFDSYILQHE